MKKYLVGKGMVGLLRSFMYCQSTLILLHKTAYRSSIYWSQCTSYGKHKHLYWWKWNSKLALCLKYWKRLLSELDWSDIFCFALLLWCGEGKTEQKFSFKIYNQKLEQPDWKRWFQYLAQGKNRSIKITSKKEE